MAKELQTTYPHLAVKAQLIYGLPGQTAGTWRETLRNVTQQNIIPLSFLNEPLPASPAMYDLEYQRRFQFEYVLSNRLTVNKTIYQSHIPKKSSSFDQVDIVQMNILSVIYSAIAVLNVALTEHNMPIFDVELIVEDFLKTKECQRLYDNLYSNWTKDNNFYYTINFSGTPQLIEDITISELLDDNKFLFYLTKFLSADIRKTFLKFVVSHNLKNTVLEIFSDTD
jgi:hypothetical protein